MFLLAFVSLLFACTGNSVANKQFGNADSLIVSFMDTTDKNSNSFIHEVVTTDKTAITKLLNFVKNKKAKANTCKPEGSMRFYRNDELLVTIWFKYRDIKCREFYYEWNGQTQTSALKNEAASFLESLAQGKNWY